MSTGQDMTSARSVQPELRTLRTRAVTLGRICRGRARFLLSGASEVGKNPVLIGKATFQLRGSIRIGNFFMIEGTVPVLIKVAPGASLSIGDGAVIGANSVVTKSIPPNTFAAGSPAQVLRKLDIPEKWQRV